MCQKAAVAVVEVVVAAALVVRNSTYLVPKQNNDMIKLRSTVRSWRKLSYIVSEYLQLDRRPPLGPP